MTLESHGELIKKLRKSRGISQAQLAYGICSRSAVARLETEGTHVSVDFLCAFLQRMNINLADYWELYFKNTKKEHIYSNVYQAILNNEIDSLKKIYLEVKELYSKTGDIYWLELKIKIVEAIEKDNVDFSYADFKVRHREDLSALSNYLKKVESWNKFEITLFINLIQYLPIPFVRHMATEIERRIDLRKTDNQELYAKALVNIIVFYFENGLLDVIPLEIEKLTKITNYERLHSSILEAYFSLLCAEIQQLDNNKKITLKSYKMIEIYQTMGYKDYYDNLVNFRKRMLKKSKLSKERK